MTKKSSKTTASSGKSKRSNERRLRAEDLDEIDAFAAQRGHIELESDAEGQSGDSDYFDEEAILDLPDGDDSASEEDVEDVDHVAVARDRKREKEAALRAKTDKKTKKKTASMSQLAAAAGDSDDDILYDRLHREASDDEENAAAMWGRGRKNFYAEEESADAVAEEAQEARRLQKKKLAGLKFSDFVDEDASLTARPKTGAAASQKKRLQFEDVADFGPSDSETDAVAPLDEEDTNEFLALIKDFQGRLQLLRSEMLPLMQRAQEGTLPSGSGLSFLQLKYHVMLAYCSSVVYYLMLKGRGGRVEGHPVFKRLIRYRLLLEKIRPLETKMRFQIEKLLAPQTSDTHFRPNPDQMASVDQDADEEEDKDAEDGGRLYRAPKLAPVHYPEMDDSETAKSRRSEERRAKAANKSRLLAELRGELDTLPEEESIDPVRMAARAASDRKAIDRDAYEEENFVRFQVSKKEQRRLEKTAKPLDELDDLDDFFGELDEINETVRGNSKQGKRSASIAAYLDEINGGESTTRESAPSRKEAKYTGSDESDIEDDTPRLSRDERKRATRQGRLTAARASRGPVEYRPIADRDGAAPRPASYNIVRNKGLTPSRSKEQRNPRVRQRTRYEKAVKKLSSFRGGRMSSDTSKPYGGETSGIRTNLTKSVRFK